MAFKFESLDVWKKANAYTLEIYRITRTFPREELFSLTSQIKRSASSIAANIAEGAGSSSKKDFSHFLDIAIKSTYETVSHVFLAWQLGYISEETKNSLYEDAEVLTKRIQSFRIYLRK